MKRMFLISLIGTLLGFLNLALAQAGDTLAIDSDASLTDRVALTIKGTFSCPPDSFTTLNITVRQLSGGRIAIGSYYNDSQISLICDGTEQQLLLDIYPDPNFQVWHNGKAYISADLGVWTCDGNGCTPSDTAVTKEIRVRPANAGK
ncbi:MAG: hypothetical protein V9G98_09050 [Candidatus Competibacter sp.]